MFSHKYFTPGKNSDAGRMIRYYALYNSYFPNSEQLRCLCTQDRFDKSTIPQSDSPSQRASRNMKIAYLAKSKLGGTTQYGNSYLGQPLALNYLGRMEGQPGGGGAPLRNTFV